MKGYLKGTPKVLNASQLNYNFTSSQYGYLIRAKIARVNPEKVPLLSKRTESGVSMFDNDMVGETVCTDKTGLEDAITSQEIEFELLDGYYFNAGHNNTIKQTIRHIHSKRRNLKTTQNPAQLVIKGNNE